ncbi:PsbP-related protein [Paenibacillus sp. BIC5C1]|uniref:PsbP-related protein n=1 Tax=Paenibacillus sp. BIC5C1 TaxID=3078263 RepID=UPI0028ECCAC2|nr:PsbP-related protein [Paenibacillus sp. BIC5C1]
MKKLITILALTALLSACGNSETTKTADTQTSEPTNSTETVSTEAKGTKYITYSGEGISFSYPDSWKSVDTSQMNSAVKAAFSNQSSSANFADNINLTIEANPAGSINPEEFANNAVDYYTQNGSSIGISEYKKTSYTNKPYKENSAGVLEGTYKHSTGTDIVLVQYLIPTNTELYSMTLTYARDTYNKDEVNEILDSLSITAPIEQTAQSTTTGNSSAAASAADFFNDLTPFVTSDTAVLDQVSYDFIANHSDLFPASTAELRKNAKGLVNSKVTTRHLNKNVANYYEDFVKVSGQVVQVEEDNSLGSTFSIVLVMDDNGNYVTAIYPSTTGDLLDGDFATVIGAPIANYSFQNVGGGYTNSTLIGASLVVAD